MPVKTSDIDIQSFLNPTPESAYALGFLWGDGSFDGNSVRTEILASDALEVLPIFNAFGKWNAYSRLRPNRQLQTTINAEHMELNIFLKSHGYVSYRTTSPDSIIEFLPAELRRFWFLGFFDADGCLYYNEKNGTSQCVFSGSYNQDWHFVEKMLRDLDTPYFKASKQNLASGKSSRMRFCNKQNIYRFGKFIYAGHDLGLSRKRAKFKSMFENDPRYYDIGFLRTNLA